MSMLCLIIVGRVLLTKYSNIVQLNYLPDLMPKVTANPNLLYCTDFEALIHVGALRGRKFDKASVQLRTIRTLGTHKPVRYYSCNNGSTNRKGGAFYSCTGCPLVVLS